MVSRDLVERKRLEAAMRTEGPMVGHLAMRYCRHDRRMVHPLGPSPAWRIVAPVVGVVGFLVVIGVTFIDPIGIATLIAALVYIATLGPAIALARKTPRCPLCGRDLLYHSEAEALAAERPAPTTAPAAPAADATTAT